MAEHDLDWGGGTWDDPDTYGDICIDLNVTNILILSKDDLLAMLAAFEEGGGNE